MKRDTLNFLIDLASALILLGIIQTGLLLRFALPPGSGGRILWGMTRHEWGDVHFWLAVSAAVALVVHVAMHWSWVCITVVRLLSRGRSESALVHPVARNFAGVGVMIVLLLLCWGFVWIAQSNVQTGSGGGRHGVPHSGSSESTRQSMDAM